MKDWLTGKEAAKELGVTVTSVCYYIRDGKLKAEKQGGVWHIKKPELDRFTKERKARCNIPDGHVSMQEAEERLYLTRSALQTRINKGLIKHKRIKWRWKEQRVVIPEEEVIKYENQMKNGGVDW